MAETLSLENDIKLGEASRVLFGGQAELRLVCPSQLILLRKNARYMRKAVFDQLTDNVRRDGFLSSVPLCQEIGTDQLEVLSGNHRVQAAIAAGIEKILIIAIPQIESARKIAIQLSHNALTGEDDQQLLAELWSELQDLNEQLYSGLDSDSVGELDPVAFHSFNPAQPKLRTITLCFLPEEASVLDELLSEADAIARADDLYLAPASHYDPLFEALAETRQTANIKNTTVAFMWLINRLMERNIFASITNEHTHPPM